MANLSYMKVNRRKLLFGLSIVILVVLFIYPWKQVLVVPAMRVRILDESGNPAPGAVVKQKWEYRAIGSQEYQEMSKADENGYVSFPERTERISLLRLVPSYAREMVHLPHGYGFGPSIVIWAYGEDPHVWHYVPFSDYYPAPQEIRLERNDEPKYPHQKTWP
jgi:hypothetical protein